MLSDTAERVELAEAGLTEQHHLLEELLVQTQNDVADGDPR